ncbi:unnamed protein product [Rhizophagus irregularis]|nr:unnamed protein product [Rhizophagus irregularis]
MRICDICDAPPEILKINHSETKNDLQSRSSISNVDVLTENNSSFHKTISDYGGYRKSSYQEKVSKSSPEISHVYTPPEEIQKIYCEEMIHQCHSQHHHHLMMVRPAQIHSHRIVPMKLKQTPSKKKSKEIKS